MTSTADLPDIRPTTGQIVERVFTIGFNLVTLYIARNLVRWDVLPFLTDDWDRVVPAIAFSVTVAVVVNAVLLAFSPHWLEVVGQAATTLAGLPVIIQLLSVFPFDFGDQEIPWGTLVRLALIVALCASILAVLVAPLRLLGRPSR